MRTREPSIPLSNVSHTLHQRVGSRLKWRGAWRKKEEEDERRVSIGLRLLHVDNGLVVGNHTDIIIAKEVLWGHHTNVVCREKEGVGWGSAASLCVKPTCPLMGMKCGPHYYVWHSEETDAAGRLMLPKKRPMRYLGYIWTTYSVFPTFLIPRVPQGYLELLLKWQGWESIPSTSQSSLLATKNVKFTIYALRDRCIERRSF